MYVSCNLIRPGNTARHGPHHTAQKSSSTTLPFSPASDVFSPLSAKSAVNSGAGLSANSSAGYFFAGFVLSSCPEATVARENASNITANATLRM